VKRLLCSSPRGPERDARLDEEESITFFSTVH
jgi:hypothetical protein